MDQKKIEELMKIMHSQLISMPNLRGLNACKWQDEETFKHILPKLKIDYKRLFEHSNLEEIDKFLIDLDVKQAREICMDVPVDVWKGLLEKADRYHYWLFLNSIIENFGLFRLFEQIFDMDIVNEKVKNIKDLLDIYKLVSKVKVINRNYHVDYDYDLIEELFNKSDTWEIYSALDTSLEISSFFCKSLLELMGDDFFKKIFNKNFSELNEVSLFDILNCIYKADKDMYMRLTKNKKTFRKIIMELWYPAKENFFDIETFKKSVKLFYKTHPDTWQDFLDYKKIKDSLKLDKLKLNKTSMILKFLIKKDYQRYSGLLYLFLKNKEVKEYFNYEEYSKNKDVGKKIIYIVDTINNIFTKNNKEELKILNEFIQFIMYLLNKQLESISFLFRNIKKSIIPENIDEFIKNKEDKFYEDHNLSVEAKSIIFKYSAEDNEEIFVDSKEFEEEYQNHIFEEKQRMYDGLHRKINKIIQENEGLEICKENLGMKILLLKDMISFWSSNTFYNKKELIKTLNELKKIFGKKVK